MLSSGLPWRCVPRFCQTGFIQSQNRGLGGSGGILIMTPTQYCGCPDSMSELFLIDWAD